MTDGMTTYYRMARGSKAARATPRTRCDNCGRPLSEHKSLGFDRDGELHECPKRRTAGNGK